MTFKIYKRKIRCYYLPAENPASAFKLKENLWFDHSVTYAYPTCKAAVAALTAKHPGKTFKANFSKD